MKKCCIIYNTEKKVAVDFFRKTKKFLEDKKIEIEEIDKLQLLDFAIVIGGDGTLLRASKILVKNPEIDIIAINAGSLGFLTEISIDDGLQAIERYLKGDYRVKTRRILEIAIKDKIYDALNEVVISKGGVMTKLLRIGVYSDGEYMNTYRADGLIIATPTGSTAYSMAAGGPIVTPGVKALVLTPIAAHNLTARPVVINGDEVLTIKIEDENRIGYAVIDGETCAKIQYKDVVTVAYTGKKIKLVLPKDLSYYGILRETLKWGDKLC
ncbi:MAG: NAD(+)/NADH kinase [Fusobacteriaceae bacterium]